MRVASLVPVFAALPVFAEAQEAAGDARPILLTGAEVVTMEDGWTAPVAAEILVEGDRITAIGPDIDVENAREIDLSGHLITPGLVDGHWHMWNSIARGYERSDRGGFSATMKPFSAAWTPEASALSVELAMALAVDGGITWVNNWAHNVKGPEFAAAEIEAMRASGVRGRFSYGYPQAAGESETMDLADLKETAEGWEPGMIELGVALRGPDRSEQSVWEEEIEAARALGLPITFHMGGSPDAADQRNVALLDEAGVLGEDIAVVHMTSASEDDLTLLAASEASLIISPWTEMQVGYGIPDPGTMAASGLRMGLSVDNTVLAGQVNMFEVMRLTADLADAAAHEQQTLADATVFDWATKAGAEAIGAAEGVGFLSVGGPADLIALDMEALDIRPAASADFALTHAAEPRNVNFVMIGGAIHKEDGVLTRVDMDDLLTRSQSTMDAIAAEIN